MEKVKKECGTCRYFVINKAKYLNPYKNKGIFGNCSNMRSSYKNKLQHETSSCFSWEEKTDEKH